MTIQEQECRRHQPNYHLFAFTTIKTKPKDDFSYSLPSGHLISPPAILAPPCIQKAACWGHSELRRGKGQACSPLLNAAHLHQILLCRTPPTLWATNFKTYLGTPALEPMPEDCRECRRFLAVASGWASASCWMAACRALREAASLGGGMKRISEHVDVGQGQGGLAKRWTFSGSQVALYSRGS